MSLTLIWIRYGFVAALLAFERGGAAQLRWQMNDEIACLRIFKNE